MDLHYRTLLLVRALRLDEAGEEPPWDGGGVCLPLFAEKLPHRLVLSISPADPHTESPEPPYSPHDDRRAFVAERAALSHPAAAGEMGEREPEDEEEGTGVGGVPHVCVEAVCDKTMFGMYGEVEGE